MDNFKPVVIIGAPRSGTNMLRDVLCKVDGFCTWPCDEINYVWRYGNASSDTDELSANQVTEPIKRYIRNQFAQIAAGYDGQYVVEKTCANSLRVGFVDAVLPDAKYIFIHRNGVDVAASATLRWKSKFDFKYTWAKLKFVPLRDFPYYMVKNFLNRLKQSLSPEKRLSIWGPQWKEMQVVSQSSTVEELSAKQWAACVSSSLGEFECIDKSRVYAVCYDEFVQAPLSHMEEILEFIGADRPENLESIVPAVRKSSLGKGYKQLDADSIKKVEAIVSPLEARLASFSNGE